jgi:hypothetical protein
MPTVIIILLIAISVIAAVSIWAWQGRSTAKPPEKCNIIILNPCSVNEGEYCILGLIVNSSLSKNYSVNGIEAISNKAFTLRMLAISNKTITIAASDENKVICSTSFLMNVTKKDAMGCGNKKCETGENCGNCPEDCACTSGECMGTVCYAIECSIKKDCDDNDKCTADSCHNAGTTGSVCRHKEITSCEDDDNCCPGECNAGNDNDC